MPKRTDAGWDLEQPYEDLADYDKWWWPYWQGMPEFKISNMKKYHTLKVGIAGTDPEKPRQVINVHFDSEDSIRDFSQAVGIQVTQDVKGIWFPHPPPVELTHAEANGLLARRVQRTVTPQTRGMWFPHDELTLVDKRYCSHAPGTEPAPGEICRGGDFPLPRYPVYIPSKGRWNDQKTMTALDHLRIPYTIVVEPREADQYAAVFGRGRLLELPDNDGGLHAARNFIWEHAVSVGAPFFWQLDDNIRGIYRFNYNLKTPCADGAVFRAAEAFVERYDNLAQAGFQYFMFMLRKEKRPPFLMNTRIYSCTLNRTDLPYRYRHRFNDDTDLSLQVLKGGWSTILFQAFLAHKLTTMTIKGGNTPIYQGTGRLQMAQALTELHPDVVTVTRKWGRYQHQVDYRPFAGNRPKMKPEYLTEDGRVRPEVRGTDDFGMVLEHQGADGLWRRLETPRPYRV